MGKSIAVFGTGSHTGKTTIVAAMCCYFNQNGLQVYPFKAFNLSSNSFLYQGNQIGYAQYIQAIASGRAYEVGMNPVLNKYENGEMSYVIHGVEQRTHEDNRVEFLRGISTRAYRQALEKNDLVIVEGSGSCCELNLKNIDVANMHFALKHNIPVILVGDIGNGGIFGSLYGTISLFSKEERALVKGIIVNRFFGDPARFQEGKKIIEDICDVKVVSVMPFVEFCLPEEDQGDKNAPSGQNNQSVHDEIEKLTEIFKKNTDLTYLQKIVDGGI